MKVGDQDRFCSACGKSLTGEQETELYSFGPGGVSVCFSRPRFFVWTQRNNTKIVLTNRRIYGSSIFSADSLRFQVPYEAILATESFNFIFWKVVWIQYRDVKKIREVSIMCNPFNSYHIARVYNLLQEAHR
jgi:hypothetical protein